MRDIAIRGPADGYRTGFKECGTTLLTARSTGAIDHPPCLDAHSSSFEVRVKSHEPSAGKMVSLTVPFTVGGWTHYSGSVVGNAKGLVWHFGAYIELHWGKEIMGN